MTNRNNLNLTPDELNNCNILNNYNIMKKKKKHNIGCECNIHKQKKMYKNKTRGEISIQFMDYKKLNLFLGWKPKYKFKQTLPELFKWYQSYFKKNK